MRDLRPIRHPPPAALSVGACDCRAWTYLVFSAGTTIPLATIGLDLPVDRIYEGVALDPDPPAEREESPDRHKAP